MSSQRKPSFLSTLLSRARADSPQRDPPVASSPAAPEPAPEQLSPTDMAAAVPAQPAPQPTTEVRDALRSVGAQGALTRLWTARECRNPCFGQRGKPFTVAEGAR